MDNNIISNNISDIDISNNSSNNNNNNKIFILGGLLVILIIILGYTLTVSNNNVISIGINSGENVYTYKSYIYIYGKNGMKIIKDEDVLLEDTFSTENPFVVTCDDKIAISDKNGKILRMYTSTHQMYTLNFINPILGFNINKNGYVSVISKVNENYGINVYNENGTELYAIKDISLKEGIPVSTAISHDNKVISIAYLNIYEPTVSSNIVLYSMSNNIAFGGSIKKNQVVSNLNFTTDNNLIGFSDKEIFIIKVNTNKDNLSSKEIYQNIFENTIKYISFLDKDNYIVCYGNPNLGSDSEIINNTIIFYNASGGEKGKYMVNDNITNIFSNEYGLIVSNNRLFTGISKTSAKIWEYQATQDIKNVLYYENKNRIIIVSNNEIKITKINKTLFDADLIDIDDNNNNNNNYEYEIIEKDSDNKDNEDDDSVDSEDDDNNDVNDGDSDSGDNDDSIDDNSDSDDINNNN